MIDEGLAAESSEYWVQNQLRRAVTALALPAQEQLRLWTQPLPLPEEMATAFEGAWRGVSDRPALLAVLDEAQRQAMARLDAALATLTAGAHESSCFDDEWVESRAWHPVREAANRALLVFGWDGSLNPWDDVTIVVQ